MVKAACARHHRRFLARDCAAITKALPALFGHDAEEGARKDTSSFPASKAYSGKTAASVVEG